MRFRNSKPDMRVSFCSFVVFVALTGIFFCLPSCKQGGSNPPTVQLFNGTGYVYEDTTLAHGTLFTISVYATKMGVDDLLESGKITRSINGGPDSVLQDIKIVTTQFNQFYSYIAGDSGNTERYTFTFSNQNGLTNSATVKVTDN